ncbi:MAG: hypothetical protein ACLP50_21915, partial [Solirubrobacteraceae bacterium]
MPGLATSAVCLLTAAAFGAAGISHVEKGVGSEVVLKRTPLLPPEHVFPTDEWRIVEARFSESYARQCETAFALSNGYVGVRGAFD